MPRFLLAFAVLLAAAGLAVAQTPPQPAAGQAVATFAGGCFWCTEADFDKLKGVVATTSPSTTRLFSDTWWPPNRQPHARSPGVPKTRT